METLHNNKTKETGFMVKREFKAAALAAAVCGVLVAHPECAVAEAPESQDPIKIALFD